MYIFSLIIDFYGILLLIETRTSIIHYHSVPICRYITKSLEEENSAYSFVGVFLVKEYSVLWISQIKEILQKCNIYLKNFFTRKDVVMTSTELQNATVILLHTMVSFTSINTWRIFHASNLKAETLQVLKPGLNQLCSNFIGFLVHHEFYSTLRVRIKF